MKADELRKGFLEFFKSKKHKIVASSSLLPGDPSVLLTTAGMQQFKLYYTGDKDALKDFGVKRTASIQKCFRTSDIDEVGDESHLTFFEMLGNFSFEDYFKKEAIEWGYEFVNQILKVDKKRIYFSVFNGEKGIPMDKESLNVINKLGRFRIIKAGKKDNFWGPTGNEGPCGPTAEIYVDNLELWNLVFNEYYQDNKGRLTKLKKNGIDTGMGLERLAVVMQKKKNIFETDLFHNIMRKINELENKKDVKAERIIADHLRGAVFLIGDGVRPSNVAQGYILRRVLRRAIRYAKLLELKGDYIKEIVNEIINIYAKTYPELNNKEIIKVIEEERRRFERALESGLKEFTKLNIRNKVSGKQAFYLYESFGFPLELTRDLAREKKLKVDERGFEVEFRKHQEISKGDRFKSGLVEITPETIRLHTATHLLQQALRDVLGEEIEQKGSNITKERLRFDFNFGRALSKEEIKNVEDRVNSKIKEDLKVSIKETTLEEARKEGVIGVFEGRYGEKVKVYSIGNYSKELCGGPHVNSTKEIGRFRIIKEESSSAGIRRIKAVLE